MVKGKLNIRASLAAVGIGFWLTMAGGVSAGPGGDERIIGGNVANPADWPFAAAITDQSENQFCGGTVISEDAVLTAAHCLLDEFGDPVDPNSLRVITGRPDLNETGDGQVLEVDDFFVHRMFLRKERHDVAVIRLDDPTTATPAVLASVEEDAEATEPGDELRVAGWGSTKRSCCTPSDELLALTISSVKPSKCEKSFWYYRADEEICTLGEKNDGDDRTSSCFGDSGGPLVANTLGGPRVVGAVSYAGRRCGVKHPTVYARVADNLNFITDKAGL